MLAAGARRCHAFAVANEKEAVQLRNVQKATKVVVAIALGLLVYTFFKYDPTLVKVRAGAWVIAGLLSVAEAMILKKIGAKSGNAWINAAIYIAVAFVPILRGR